MGHPASYRVSRVRYYSGVISAHLYFAYGTFTSFGPAFQPYSAIQTSSLDDPQPLAKPGLGSSHFARRYFGNRCFFLFLRVLRCFSSPRSLLASYVFRCGCVHITAHGFPHSDICGCNARLQLTAAFRSLPRPSSAPSAKASALCS